MEHFLGLRIDLVSVLHVVWVNALDRDSHESDVLMVVPVVIFPIDAAQGFDVVLKQWEPIAFSCCS